ncbi:MAG: peptidase S8 [Terriglobia bacterium]|nr:MAG: peptidase S8 [Terriglobia bacterium]
MGSLSTSLTHAAPTEESGCYHSSSMTRAVLVLLLFMARSSSAAPPNRVTRPVDTRQIRAVIGNLHRSAQAQFDRGTVEPDMRMDDIVVMMRPSAEQQADLERLLSDQQNPSSALFHRWLTPEEFGDRFGLGSGDHSKIAGWLASEGFTIRESARGRNWIAFSGTARQVANALHTPIHRFEVGGRMHFANAQEPSVPEALTPVISGFLGLDDFQMEPFARPVPPEYNLGNSHYLVPEDFATIYNIAPLYRAGLDGAGQSIAIVGQSEVLLSDIRAFRARYNLPANDPKIMLYGTTDPGFNSAQIEGNLDLEWAGAIAPKAAIYYIYGPNAFTATVTAVNLNLARIISISYGSCEGNASLSFYRSIGQQANAQGITILSASGDSGAAGCDLQGLASFATHGRQVSFPAVLPEVTAVGGTQFVEGNGTFWATNNSPNFGSALSYIPEAAWNESGTIGLLSSGGGSSLFYPKPPWQAGVGVPDGNARHIPDVSLSAALHDAYFVTYQGANAAVAGTSASAPSLAGIIALLNQYQVANGFQKQPGLGNINPQLYRLAQAAPAAFHDIVSGDNIVVCAQGSPDCLTGSYGYRAGTAYDLATGLGSVDANILVTQWNTQTADVNVALSVNADRVTLNDSIEAIATVSAPGGGMPTGTISFSINGITLGSLPLSAGSAKINFPLYRLGAGFFVLSAQYSGDAAFSAGGATRNIQVIVPAGAAAIIPTAPNTVWPAPPDAQGLAWQATLGLREAAGVPAIITGFTIDGKAQSLSQYFPSVEIPAGGTVSTTVIFRNLAAPLVRTFGFTGVDAKGLTWSREISVSFLPLPTYNYFNVSATPLVVTQNAAADPACQWAVQLNVDEMTGNQSTLTGLFAGGVALTSQIPAIFGTTRLTAFSSLQGLLCFGGITPPATNAIEVDASNGIGRELTISFAGAPGNPAKLSAIPARVNLTAAAASQTAQAQLAIGITDKTQPWTISIFPANRTTAWLSASQLSGVGPAQITLTASAAGFAPGSYQATLVIQSANASPQYLNVPVMFVNGASSYTVISAVASAATYQAGLSPGMLLSVFGSNLANTTQAASGSPLTYSIAGVSATVNGVGAPLISVSPTQINLQIPYEVGAGPAVLGINKNGEIAGFPIQIAAAAPGIFADSNGNLGSGAVAPGGVASLFLTGAGEVSPAFRTAFAPSASTSPANLPKPRLPLSITLGGIPAFVQFAGLAPNLIGITQVNFIVPASLAAGPQPVVVTIGGVSSPPATLTVAATAQP